MVIDDHDAVDPSCPAVFRDIRKVTGVGLPDFTESILFKSFAITEVRISCRFEVVVSDETLDGIDTDSSRNKCKSLKYNWHQADVTILEGLLARGDRKVAKSILAAYRKGCIYDAWGEQFHYDRWLEAFEETGLDLDFYTTRARELDEVFPWDFIDIGVTKKFLEREWMRATEETVTPNCRMQCSGCGAMKYEGGVCFEH